MSLLDENVGRLARRIPGATRVFHEYQLDFCCGGNQPLKTALAEKAIAPEPVLTALERLLDEPIAEQSWDKASRASLIDHILERYHERHREQLPELIRLSMRVEQVHQQNPDCPRGLAEHLNGMLQELESHMLKEEQVLFPLLRRGYSTLDTAGPISVMKFEHDHHGEALERIGELTDQISLPKGACNTWRALYTGLAQFREDLMQHIHLENNILFTDVQEALHD